MARRASLAVVIVVSFALAIQRSASASSIEAEVFSKINAERGSSFIHHSGLRAVAYQHSQGMSQRGGLDHNDADSRISSAAPDPRETNGAPDDGVPPAAWCENVTYVMYAPESEVADRIYAAWEGSGAHGRCMRDTSRNVAAVGVYYDGEAWWATFIANVDDTPPGGARTPEEASGAKRETKPKATAPPPAAQTTPDEVPANETSVAEERGAEVPPAGEGSLTTVIRFDPPVSDEPTKLRLPAGQSENRADSTRVGAMAPPVQSRTGAPQMPPLWQVAATAGAAILLASRVAKRPDSWLAPSGCRMFTPSPSTPLAFTEERSAPLGRGDLPLGSRNQHLFLDVVKTPRSPDNLERVDRYRVRVR